jgi:hypothetical protein
MVPGRPSMVVVACLILTIAGCGSPQASPASSVLTLVSVTPTPSPIAPVLPSSPAPPTPSAATAASPQPTLPATGGGPSASLPEFDHDAFASSTRMDNEWFPLEPGNELVLQGKATVDGERISRKVVITVTDLTKVIDGVRTVVVYEVDYTGGEVEEIELAFFAQDDEGAVWHMGEYPEEWEEGKFVKAPTWIAGIADARAGIAMMAHPAMDTPSYAQGWGPAVGWTDRARVLETGSKTCVPTGCYTGVLVTDEFNRDEPDTHQLKYYAPGIGNVRVGWAGAREEEQEVLQLTSFRRLGANLLAQVRDKALALDKHGYRVSKDVYAKTPPIERPSP